MEHEKLFRADNLKNLIQEPRKCKINIAAVQEIHWKGNDIFDSDDCIVCYNGSNGRNIFVKGFLVCQKLTDGLYSSISTDMLFTTERKIF
jgi:hypothetical protein